MKIFRNMRNSLRRCRELWPETCLAGVLYLLLVTELSFVRGLLLWNNPEAASGVFAALLTESFFVGLRFDLAVAAYLITPFLLLLLCRRKRIAWVMFHAMAGAALLLSIAGIEFFWVVGSRFNLLALKTPGHPFRFDNLLPRDCPVGCYLLLWGGLMFVLVYVGAVLAKCWLKVRIPALPIRDRMLHLMGSVVVLAMLVILSRGGFAHRPLREGDAAFGRSMFVDQVALNGVFAPGRCAWEEHKRILPPAPCATFSDHTLPSGAAGLSAKP